jgi:hypothetical protein
MTTRGAIVAIVECAVVLSRHGSELTATILPMPVCLQTFTSRTRSNASYPNPRRGGIIPVSKKNRADHE